MYPQLFIIFKLLCQYDYFESSLKSDILKCRNIFCWPDSKKYFNTPRELPFSPENYTSFSTCV